MKPLVYIAGYAPICPHDSLLLDLIFPLPYGVWLAYSLELVRRCDVVYRMEGESPGADKEVAFAKKLGIPVVYSIDELRSVMPVENDEPIQKTPRAGPPGRTKSGPEKGPLGAAGSGGPGTRKSP
jgi:hypothetical protein